MLTEFAQDLRLARRKSGLSQKEVASLLAIDQSTFSDLERGEKPPSVQQVCQFMLIFGRNFRSLFEEIVAAIKPDLQVRLESFPSKIRPRIAAGNRAHSIRQLGQRLGMVETHHGLA